MAEQEPKGGVQTSEKPPVKGEIADKKVSLETRRSIARLLFGGFIRMDYSADPKRRDEI